MLWKAFESRRTTASISVFSSNSAAFTHLPSTINRIMWLFEQLNGNGGATHERPCADVCLMFLAIWETRMRSNIYLLIILLRNNENRSHQHNGILSTTTFTSQFSFPIRFSKPQNVFLRNSVYFAWLLVIFFSCFCLSYGNVFFIACAFHFVFISMGNATIFWRPANFILFISVQPKVHMRKKNKTEAALKIRTMKMPNSLWNVIF